MKTPPQITAEMPYESVDEISPPHAWSNLRLQHGHSPSNSFSSVLNAVGWGSVMIALNASGSRWA